MIRVLLVDDHAMVRAGLQRLLDQTPDIQVVAVAETGEDALGLVAELEPDVVLMDVSMPGMSGIDAARQIVDRGTAASVVILTASADQRNVVDALDAGAVGYLMKDAEPHALIDGVRSAAAGDAPLDPRAARTLLDSRQRPQRPILTSREREVLLGVSEGLANKAIAVRLGIREKTVKSHLTKIFSGLGVTDRTQAALWAKDNL